MKLPSNTTAREAPWNRCDECGRFISLDDFGAVGEEVGPAVRYLITPDSEFTDERYETFCAKHAGRKAA